MSVKEPTQGIQRYTGKKLWPCRIYRILLSFLCLHVACFEAVAQLPPLAHYTVKDGLPSNKTYSMRLAPDGYIWIATNKGISRFDGSRFRNFSVADGLPTNDIFYVYTDVTGKVWLMNFKNGLYYLKNDTIHQLYDPEQITRQRRVLPATYDQGKICVFGVEGQYHGWYWYVYQDTIRRNTFYDSVARVYGNDQIVYCDLKRAAFLGPDYIGFVQGNLVRRVKVPRHNVSSLRAYRTQMAGTQIYCNKLIAKMSLKSFLVVDLEHFRARELRIDTLNSSWAIASNVNGPYLEITTNTGLLVFDASLQVVDAVDFGALAGKEELCGATKDKSGNIWIISKHNGLYLLPFFYRNVQLWRPQATEGTIIKSVHTGTSTYMLDTRNHLSVHKKDGYQYTISLPDKANPGRMPENINLLPDKHGGLYISSTKGLWYLDAQRRLKDLVPLFCADSTYPWAVGIKAACYDAGEDRCYISNQSKILSYSPRSGIDKGHFDGRYMHIAAVDRHSIWLANDDGVTRCEKRVVAGKLRLIPAGRVKDIQVENMTSDTAGNVIVQVSGKGLMIFNGAHAPYQIAEPSIQLIKLAGGGLWMVSDKGIQLLTLNAGKYRVQHAYPNIKRLLYDEVYDLYSDARCVTVMTNGGILKVPLDPMHYKDTLFTRKPVVTVNYAGRRIKPVAGHVEQDWQNTNIGFSVGSFSASYLGTIRYEYFINGLDHTRQYTAEPLITYPVLSPGTYYVHIRACVNDIALTSEEIVLTLVIKPRYWQSLWFKMGILLAVSVTILFFFAWRIRKKRAQLLYQASLEHKAAQMELKALQSQMNPHFIFNALGAVKSHFRFNRVQEADQMLEDFAQLIRLYLEFSRNQLISLQQDIQALQLYTAIEQGRFDHRFSVHFFKRISPDQENKWQLPPMILQPFVENAINHGLFRKQGQGGRLRLFFLHREDRLTVVIDDNGVGRKRAAEIGSRFQKIHPSRGNSLVADRIQVLNGLGISKIKFEIVDKYDCKAAPAGTRVIIHFLRNEL